ncbi:MAG: UTP--glucose-1-phosphate uridylyltransferase [Candidatus Sungbacteria bacterium]|nr:UTP--glucose-1-phosphate uridylyltransferase [Candidatus Sungbacteria bacterium]
MRPLTKVIIPVAGLGTRFLPATKAQPKAMLPLIDKPVIQFLVEEAVASGITDIIFVTGRGKRAIEDHFDYSLELEYFLRNRGKTELADRIHAISSLAKFTYVRESEPLGPGHAVLQARHLIGHDEPVAVLYEDDVVDAKVPCLKQLMDVFDLYHKPVLALDRVPKKMVSRYGIVGVKKISNRTFRVTDMIEKPKIEEAPSNLVSRGKYIYTPELLDLLAVMKPGPGGELYQTGAFQLYLKKGGEMYGYEYEGILLDCGEKLGFAKAMVQVGLKHPEIGKQFRQYLKKLDI